MENLIEDESVNNSDESSDSSNGENTKDLKWEIDFKKELLFLETKVLKSSVYQPTVYPKCKYATYKIKKKKVMIY